ncbi:Acyl-CoA dehydrogenase [Minicystis rosea]|nr:Acyl-CoA dehydrogenase [Minicystis rosea]
MHSLHAILTTPLDAAPIASREVWWDRHVKGARTAPRPFDEAVLGGFAADRVGYAFASGYQAALRSLVPDLPRDLPASICVTERGGGHPRAIETRLEPLADDRFRITGHKRWATLGDAAGILLVVASTGPDEHGKNRLRVARVDAALPGVKRRATPEPPFAPEIAHDEIDLEGVIVGPDDLLPGDGFDRYVRPFRTVEDLHVQAAVYAYLIREIRAEKLPSSLAERFAALLASLEALTAAPPSAPAVHVALAGALALAQGPLDELDRAWAKVGSSAYARWQRDRPLLAVATKVREQRLAKAWDALAEPPRAS